MQIDLAAEMAAARQRRAAHNPHAQRVARVVGLGAAPRPRAASHDCVRSSPW